MENIDQNNTWVWNKENYYQNNYEHNTIETTETQWDMEDNKEV